MGRRSDLIRGEDKRFSGRHVVVLLALLAISVSLATRTFHGVYFDHPVAQADPSHALRQHLDADAFVLTSPVLTWSAILLPVVAPHAPPIEEQIRTVQLTESLYNRPPPSTSFL